MRFYPTRVTNPFYFSGGKAFHRGSGDIGIGRFNPHAKIDISRTNTGSVGTNPHIWLSDPNGYNNSLYQIGFGYHEENTPTYYPPVVFGMLETSSLGETNGEAFIATRNVTTNTAPTIRFHVLPSGIIQLDTVPEYSDNSAALAGGLTTGQIYRTGDILKIVH